MEEPREPMTEAALNVIVGPWLSNLAGLTDRANILDKDLQSDPRYTQLAIIRANIATCEDNIKTALKDAGVPEARVESDGYEAVLQTRHGKGIIHYDLQAIEQEVTLKTCITRSVNEKLFKAVIEAKSLDASMYCTPEPGTETKAVTIRPIVVKEG